MDVREKISKLLALSTSPEQEEAKAALLKARELMVKYKIREDEIPEQNCKVIKQTLDNITCTKMTNPWIDTLANIIAEHYCCKSYRSRLYRKKESTIGFVGIEDDFNICKEAFLYAYDFVVGKCQRIRACKSQDTSTTRKMANAYGLGFCIGLRKAYQKQCELHQEWGLVLQTPQPVLDVIKGFKKECGFGIGTRDIGDSFCQGCLHEGYYAGKSFEIDPRQKEELCESK